MEGDAVVQPGELHTRQKQKGNKILKTDIAGLSRQGDSSLESQLANYLSNLEPTLEITERSQRCLIELQTVITRLGLTWKVRPFGSFANGFGTMYSDLDVTCCQSGGVPPADTQKDSALALGSWIIPMLELHKSFTIRQEILGARVPILKLMFEDTLEVDLSCHNAKPLLNTRLLKAYSLTDPRIRDLGVAIKLWAKASGVCDATKSNLSSYSFTLLVIYFMQVHEDVQLPVIPVDSFVDTETPQSYESVFAALPEWQCKLSLPELMLRFFAFYSNHERNAFAWGSEVVSVRGLQREHAGNPAFGKLRGHHVSRLHIEDPLELARNLHCVLGLPEEDQLRNAFSEAWLDMQSNQVPRALTMATHPSTVMAVSAPESKPAPPGNLISKPDLSAALTRAAEDRMGSDLVDLLRVYKTEVVADSVAGSTVSGGTDSGVPSGDESPSESFGGPPALSAIPMPTFGLAKAPTASLNSAAQQRKNWACEEEQNYNLWRQVRQEAAQKTASWTQAPQAPQRQKNDRNATWQMAQMQRNVVRREAGISGAKRGSVGYYNQEEKGYYNQWE